MNDRYIRVIVFPYELTSSPLRVGTLRHCISLRTWRTSRLRVEALRLNIPIILYRAAVNEKNRLHNYFSQAESRSAQPLIISLS